MAQWTRLRAVAASLGETRISTLFRHDPERVGRYAVTLDDLHLDYSKHLLDDDARRGLLQLAEAVDLRQRIDGLFSGAEVNNTERRPALHTLMRECDPGAKVEVDGVNLVPTVFAQRQRLQEFVTGFERGTLRGVTGKRLDTVVNLGVGGSDLGAVMASHALAGYHRPGVTTHFVSGMDGVQLADVLATVDPARTLFIISSKSFSTPDTFGNAQVMRRWLEDRLGPRAVAVHVVAISSKPEAMTAWGIADDHQFLMGEWVGGRYSVSSAVGLPLALTIGWSQFSEFLAGMHRMDRHFREAPFEQNMPVIMGLLAVWHRNCLDTHGHVVLPYDHRFGRFPAYLQQLDMESNGKSVRRDGSPVSVPTAPLLLGEFGGNAQHSFLQLIHQGMERVTVDFLLPAQGSGGSEGQQDLTLANGLAQAQALMEGRDEAAMTVAMQAAGLSPERIEALLPHRTQPGNVSSSTLVFPRVDPHHLGMLMALYEHRVFVQSVVWDINPFDQWGVELGKLMADDLIDAVAGRAEPPAEVDASTAALIRRLRRYRE
ncbi:glucose-6-phosphate isomerase [Natronocella acetinitrilica]|uniref:Glucose-6-phosphate isomerase n=1 Tax=Natronocella acetinitrilica TaxID=414046 RepID=A0AAE3G6I6_9GAMM|nr:glucose-6-phosphate isomerase [Natronocella acetinitrilica]MCP1676584.1 glucose-6-phosphate isomerase [Natronocella acetinitrilica]